jgi:hypothetical protein
MSIPIATERRLLSHDEFEVVRATHYPFISRLSAQELRSAGRDLRQHRDKAQTIARQRRREMRGKAAPRGASPATDDAHAMKRKQVFAHAVKRLNRELSRLETAERQRPSLVETSRRALELLRANRTVHHPSAGRTAGRGMAPNASDRNPVEVDPREIGRVSQAVKAAQAKRDR